MIWLGILIVSSLVIGTALAVGKSISLADQRATSRYRITIEPAVIAQTIEVMEVQLSLMGDES